MKGKTISAIKTLVHKNYSYYAEEDIQRGSKRELEALRPHYTQEKGFKIFDTWECEWWRLYKTAKQHIREHFPYRRSLAAEQLLEEIKKGRFSGTLQCNTEVTENLRSKFQGSSTP